MKGKLVRDLIPQIIIARGGQPSTKILNDSDFSEALTQKLHEEVAEFVESRESEELADILEVVYALAALSGVSQEQLEAIRQEKRTARGGFEQRIYLENPKQ